VTRIEVERVEPDRLRRQVWRFKFRDGYGSGEDMRLRLDSWSTEKRATTRSKWRPDSTVENYRDRAHNSHVHHGGWMQPARHVPFPADVQAEALAMIRGMIVIEGAQDPKVAK
jgi:hypothetical protein